MMKRLAAPMFYYGRVFVYIFHFLSILYYGYFMAKNCNVSLQKFHTIRINGNFFGRPYFITFNINFFFAISYTLSLFPSTYYNQQFMSTVSIHNRIIDFQISIKSFEINEQSDRHQHENENLTYFSPFGSFTNLFHTHMTRKYFALFNQHFNLYNSFFFSLFSFIGKSSSNFQT